MARGGKRPGAGRKPKHDENRIRDFAISAIEETFGSVQAAFAHLGEIAISPTATKRDQIAALTKLLEYAVGKPKEKVEVESFDITDIQPIKWVKAKE